jgi:hypothetical protein
LKLLLEENYPEEKMTISLFGGFRCCSTRPTIILLSEDDFVQQYADG